MNRLMLIITLLATSVSTAAADRDRYDRRDSRPYATDNWRDYDGDDYFERERAPYQRFDRTRWYRDYRSRWVTLANAYSANTNRQIIPLRGQTFDRLRIEGVRGAPMISQIRVIHLDGTTQVIRLDARLRRGTGEVVRLDDKPIEKIVVFTNPRFGGAYGLHVAQVRHRGRIGV